jgi:hypothetical protein
MPLFGRRKSQEAITAAIPGRALGASEEHQSETNAIVAAATRMLPDGTGAPFRIINSAWAQEAWRQYDVCGELHFATTWLANSASRCKLTVVNKDDLGVLDASNTTDQQVIDLVKGLIGSVTIQGELIRMMTINLTIAGDCYLLGEVGPTGEFDRWTVLSIQELTIAGPQGYCIVNIGDGKPRRIMLEDVLLMRVHRPHPRQWWQADSPTRAALPVLREMEELSKYLFATINSRLSGAGILCIPSEMSFPNPLGGPANGASNFMDYLQEAMLAPIEDMSHPGAVVPITLEGPRDSLAAIHWIQNPNAHLTTTVAELRDKAIARLALTMDLAPEILLGSANANHWGQWAIEEQSFKFHIAPILTLMTTALTEGYLRPTLIAAGIDPDKYQIWWDATDLVQRPDQGSVALDLYDRGELSGVAVRRETGFPESDKPSGDEATARALLKVLALAPGAMELIPPLMEALGLPPVQMVPPQPDGTPPDPETPDPNQPSRPLPQAPKPVQNSPRKDGKPGEKSTGPSGSAQT